ncbi:unnamed protein product [Closterium sp. NIES-65]|nr:unnamed protein product [Closterium sp. NIES-65]
MLRTISPPGSPPWHALYRTALTRAAAGDGATATTPAAGNTAGTPVTDKAATVPAATAAAPRAPQALAAPATVGTTDTAATVNAAVTPTATHTAVTPAAWVTAATAGATGNTAGITTAGDAEMTLVVTDAAPVLPSHTNPPLTPNPGITGLDSPAPIPIPTAPQPSLNSPAAQASPMPGMLQVGSTSSLFIQGAGPNGMRGAGTEAYTAAEGQCEQQPTAATTLAAREEEDGRGPARTDADAAAIATPAAVSIGKEQVELNEGAGTRAAEAMQRARQPTEEAGDTRRATAGISELAAMRLGEPLVVTSNRLSNLPRTCEGTGELPPNGTAPIAPPTTVLQQGQSHPGSPTPPLPVQANAAEAAPQAQQQPNDSSSSEWAKDEGPYRDRTHILYCPVEFDPCGGEDEAEHPEEPISPKSQEDAAPESVKLTKREIGKAAAALMRGEQLGMKGLEAAYGLQEAEDLPAVWHRFFEDMQSMLLNKAPPEPPASSPFKTIPELLRKALEKELASFKSCLRTFSKVSNGLCELQQQFRDGEVSHALRITAPTLQLTDPTLQEKLNQALDNELKTFKTKAHLTLMGYKEKEKAHWEGAAEVWTARTYSRFESFLEKSLHLFETHATPDTPAPDAHLKELAVDYMARGMARELMYHAVWIKGSRKSRARGAAKREKVRAEQALREEIQANPSTDLIGLVKTLVGPLQQRVEALEQRQPRSGTAVEHGKAAGKSRAQRRKEAKRNKARNGTTSQQPTAASAPQAGKTVGGTVATPAAATSAEGLGGGERQAGGVTEMATTVAPATVAVTTTGPAAIATKVQGATGPTAAIASTSATTQPAPAPVAATPGAANTATPSGAAGVAAQPAPATISAATLPRQAEGRQRGRGLQAAVRTSQPSAAAIATAAAVKVAMRGLKVNRCLFLLFRER